MRSLNEPALTRDQVLYPWVPRETRQKRLPGGIREEAHPRRTSVTEERLRSPQLYTVCKLVVFAYVSVCVRVCVWECVCVQKVTAAICGYLESIEDDHSRTRDGFPRNDFLGDTVQKFFVQMQRFVESPDSWNDEWLDFRNWEISLVNQRNGELALPYAHSVDTTRVYVSWILNSHFAISYYFSSSVYLWGAWFQKIRKRFLVDAQCIDTALRECPKLDVWKFFFF